MELDAPDFHVANLQEALLTDSIMPRANFFGANLREAGLAQVDWPGACLRDANLKGASLRKANLRGADLRGAKVGGADFYLVDLRDAIYDADQAEHFRRCGAILSKR
jgi:uncharacterized protein YjbI with pentapeptide repeats